MAPTSSAASQEHLLNFNLAGSIRTSCPYILPKEDRNSLAVTLDLWSFTYRIFTALSSDNFLVRNHGFQPGQDCDAAGPGGRDCCRAESF